MKPEILLIFLKSFPNGKSTVPVELVVDKLDNNIKMSLKIPISLAEIEIQDDAVIASSV